MKQVFDSIQGIDNLTGDHASDAVIEAFERKSSAHTFRDWHRQRRSSLSTALHKVLHLFEACFHALEELDLGARPVKVVCGALNLVIGIAVQIIS